MYLPKGEKESSGCTDSILIMRILFGILVVPVLVIFGAIAFIFTALYALTISPLLGLLALVIGVTFVGVLGLFEWRRVSKEIRRDDK